MRSHDESTAPNGALLLSSPDNLIPKLLTTEANLESKWQPQYISTQPAKRDQSKCPSQGAESDDTIHDSFPSAYLLHPLYIHVHDARVPHTLPSDQSVSEGHRNNPHLENQILNTVKQVYTLQCPIKKSLGVHVSALSSGSPWNRLSNTYSLAGPRAQKENTWEIY